MHGNTHTHTHTYTHTRTHTYTHTHAHAYLEISEPRSSSENWASWIGLRLFSLKAGAPPQPPADLKIRTFAFPLGLDTLMLLVVKG